MSFARMLLTRTIYYLEKTRFPLIGDLINPEFCFATNNIAVDEHENLIWVTFTNPACLTGEYFSYVHQELLRRSDWSDFQVVFQLDLYGKGRVRWTGLEFVIEDQRTVSTATTQQIEQWQHRQAAATKQELLSEYCVIKHWMRLLPTLVKKNCSADVFLIAARRVTRAGLEKHVIDVAIPQNYRQWTLSKKTSSRYSAYCFDQNGRIGLRHIAYPNRDDPRICSLVLVEPIVSKCSVAFTSPVDCHTITLVIHSNDIVAEQDIVCMYGE